MRPRFFFEELDKSQNLQPVITFLFITSILFAITSIISHFQQIPMTEKPLWPHPQYRLFQAIALPLIFSTGWLICSGTTLGLSKLLRVKSNIYRILTISAPALFVPLWLILWPTELAIALGIFKYSASGFIGLWIHHLAPALLLIHTIVLFTLALWQVFKILLREAFSIAVFSLIPTLAFWAIILR
jgi:hypothetical protein